jgi:hypothetical protein
MDILQAINDQNLFLPYFGGSEGLASWSNWLTAIRCVYGLPLGDGEAQVVRETTGRDPSQLPEAGFRTALFLCGRRSGKSRVASVIAAYESVLAGHEKKLAKGERGVVAVVAPTVDQAKIVLSYLRGVFSVPLLAAEVVSDNRDSLELRNGIKLVVLAGHYRSTRGYTLVCAIVEEAAFFGVEDEGKVKNDRELIQALRPSLATCKGKLIAISSPYSPRGWCHGTWKRSWGNDGSKTLCWRAPTLVMNPTLDSDLIAEDMATDPSMARSEWFAEWRETTEAFVPREVVADLCVRGRKMLPPVAGLRYFAFADMSGGRGDDAALAIGHKEGQTVVIDLLTRVRPPFDPTVAIGQFARELQNYGVDKVTSDQFAADFASRSWIASGIRPVKCLKNKSELYIEMLPRLMSRRVELPDDDALVDQFASLQRRTRSGGRDIVDHPPGVGHHDDLANAVSGLCDTASRIVVVGPIGYDNSHLTSRLAPYGGFDALHRIG